MDNLKIKYGFKNKGEASNIVQNLTQVPKKDNKNNTPHTENYKQNNTHQIDLLMLPNDDGYKYAVVVVDLMSGMIGAEAIKNKQSSTVLKALQDIYKKSKYLDYPVFLECDSGSEFKGEFKEHLQKKGVMIKYKRTGRHRSQSTVETVNYVIGKAMNKLMLATEIETNEVSREWRDNLNELVGLINSMRVEKSLLRTKTPSLCLRCSGDSCKLLDIGTMVRVILEEPRDVTNKKLHGTFRAGDVRWEKEPRKIIQYSLRPSQPPMYIIEGIKNVAYTRNQLQVVDDDEKPAPKEAIKKYVVEKLLKKRTRKGVVEYLVKWKNHEDQTWEKADGLPIQFVNKFK